MQLCVTPVLTLLTSCCTSHFKECLKTSAKTLQNKSDMGDIIQPCTRAASFHSHRYKTTPVVCSYVQVNSNTFFSKAKAQIPVMCSKFSLFLFKSNHRGKCCSQQLQHVFLSFNLNSLILMHDCFFWSYTMSLSSCDTCSL